MKKTRIIGLLLCAAILICLSACSLESMAVRADAISMLGVSIHRAPRTGMSTSISTRSAGSGIDRLLARLIVISLFAFVGAVIRAATKGKGGDGKAKDMPRWEGEIVCPQCGLKQSGDRLICYRCGKQLAEEQTAGEAGEPDSENDEPAVIESADQEP